MFRTAAVEKGGTFFCFKLDFYCQSYRFEGNSNKREWMCQNCYTLFPNLFFSHVIKLSYLTYLIRFFPMAVFQSSHTLQLNKCVNAGTCIFSWIETGNIQLKTSWWISILTWICLIKCILHKVLSQASPVIFHSHFQF